MSAATKKFDEYVQKVAAQLIAQLEAGTAPWQKEWDTTLSLPQSAVTGRPYRGMNSLVLLMEASTKGYRDPRWMTYKQAEALGGQVKKGEHGVQCVYWKEVRLEKAEEGEDAAKPKPKDKTGKPDKADQNKVLTRMIPCRFVVFNVEQIDGLTLAPFTAHAHDWNPDKAAETILANSSAVIKHVAGPDAFYSPSGDFIQLPLKQQFPTASGYYDTALHELGHWTGHASRLHRDLSAGFGTPGYAKEELRAEISSMMVAGSIGLPHNVDRHAAYVGAWLKALKDDPKEIFRAASDASNIRDFVMEFAKEHYFVANLETENVLRLKHEDLMAVAKRLRPDDAALLEEGVKADIQKGMLPVEAEAKMLFRTFDPTSPAFEAKGHKGFIFERNADAFVRRCAAVNPALGEKAEALAAKYPYFKTVEALQFEEVKAASRPAAKPLPVKRFWILEDKPAKKLDIEGVQGTFAQLTPRLLGPLADFKEADKMPGYPTFQPWQQETLQGLFALSRGEPVANVAKLEANARRLLNPSEPSNACLPLGRTLTFGEGADDLLIELTARGREIVRHCTKPENIVAHRNERKQDENFELFEKFIDVLGINYDLKMQDLLRHKELTCVLPPDGDDLFAVDAFERCQTAADCYSKTMRKIRSEEERRLLQDLAKQPDLKDQVETMTCRELTAMLPSMDALHPAHQPVLER